MARNSFFQFKQFKVNQDKSAMKVCTDACVLGAWAEVEEAKNILDIGTGTGLLSLMVAQRNRSARITAVELEENAFAQASENVKSSPFGNQITVFHSAIQDFNPDEKFDFIITNPPFFQSDLKSPDPKINQAHHSESLTFGDLLIAVDRLLAPDGIWNVLLPVDEGIIFQNKAEEMGWFTSRKLTLFHQKDRQPFRLLMSFKHSKPVDNDLLISELFIYEEDGKTYTNSFKKLLKDYYLIF
jgi:tRNA1Val (adenine37-N6)-methyltransferase